jgi:sterol 24-C-methyltransferase
MKRDAFTTSYSGLASSMNMLSNNDSVLSRDGVKDSVEAYEKLFAGSRENVGECTTAASIAHREKEYKTMVNSFYDLVTDFYEWGWGQSFHFAPRYVGETFVESLKRAEYHLASRLQLFPGKKVLDVGCGVGGPMRNITQFSGADITGVTINEYQVKVGNKYCVQKGLDSQARSMQGDFQDLPKMFEHGTFDAAYQIEATCHSPNKVETFKGVGQCLKKGGLFAGYEWVVLPERGYDTNNKEHVRIKEGIEVGNGLPTLATGEQVVAALEEAGFEVIEAYDANRHQHSPLEIAWYKTLEGDFSVKGFRMTHIGRVFTHCMVSTLEFLRIAPAGSVRVSKLLNATALDLVEGGQQELFTPSYYFLAKKL